MRFEDLFPNFLHQSEAEQLEFFSGYYARRTEDLENAVLVKVPVKREGGKKTKEKKITLTSDQLALLQKLGLV